MLKFNRVKIILIFLFVFPQTILAQKNCNPNANFIEVVSGEEFKIWMMPFNGSEQWGIGFLGDKTVFFFDQLHKKYVMESYDGRGNIGVGESSYAQTEQNKESTIRNRYIDKNTLLQITTLNGNKITLKAPRQFRTKDSQKYIDLESWYWLKKSEIEELQKNGISAIYVGNSNATPVQINLGKKENDKFLKILNCYIGTEKYQKCPDIPIINENLSSDQAIAELKKAKEKLDLELINQQQYDSIKVEMKKYIK